MKYYKKTAYKILKALAEGKNRVQASKEGDIAYKTYCEWYNTYPEFRASVDEIFAARNELEKEDLVATIKKASETSWQAAAWMLERKHSEEFALRKQQVELTGNVNHNIKQIQINVIDTDTKTLMENAVKLLDEKTGKEIENE